VSVRESCNESKRVSKIMTEMISTDHELIPAGCKRVQCGGVQSMKVDGRRPTGKR
jgi:hypothetical protein